MHWSQTVCINVVIICSMTHAIGYVRKGEYSFHWLGGRCILLYEHFHLHVHIDITACSMTHLPNLNHNVLHLLVFWFI